MSNVNFSNEKNTTQILVTSKRHWVKNILPILMIIIGLPFFSSKYIFIGIIFLGIGIYKILKNKSISWMLTNEELIIKSGFLPWRKMYYEIPKEDFYEAYYKKGIGGNLFGYATITLRRNDGTNSYFVESGMTNADEMTGRINDITRDLKKTPKMNFVNINPQNISIADEIQKLLELKNKGLLTEEEFNAQKQRLIK